MRAWNVVFLAATAGHSAAQDPPPAHQATGTRVGEVTDASALLWARLTKAPARLAAGKQFVKGEKVTPKDLAGGPAAWRGACPGMAGEMRVRFGKTRDLSDARETSWAAVDQAGNFARTFALTELEPATVYHYAVESHSAGAAQGALHGQFETAPSPQQAVPLTFCVLNCLGWSDVDDPAAGYDIFPAMTKLKPKFAVFTGDSVYYDNDPPKTTSVPLAKFHWERLYSLPRHVDFLKNCAAYWEKDDHDAWGNNCDPTKAMPGWTYQDGAALWRQQVPVGENPYRTFRWGRDLQIWLLESRDFRSPNGAKDGPEKTLLGREQKAWFFKTVAESTAQWKVIISPTSLTGPPGKGKGGDNLGKAGFRTEGDEVRAFLKKTAPRNCYVLVGDVHAQSHAVHPQTGLNEFTVGPAGDRHAAKIQPDPAWHVFARSGGGFCSVQLTPGPAGSAISVRLHDSKGKTVHEWNGAPHAPLAPKAALPPSAKPGPAPVKH